MSFVLYYRKPVVINTDPQRRCYDGVHFSSKTEWTAWGWLCPYSNREDAEAAALVYQEINPNNEYKIEEQQ